MKAPMTTADFFNLICDILKKKNLLPNDILDYDLATYRPIPMRTYEFNIRNNLDFGQNEGIYLDMSIEYYENDEKKYASLGTFKTLKENAEGMRIMALLLADFIIEGREYIDSHLDDFTWTGANVYVLDNDGNKLLWGYSCDDMSSALKKKDELLEKYSEVLIRDNASRKETKYSQSD